MWRAAADRGGTSTPVCPSIHTHCQALEPGLCRPEMVCGLWKKVRVLPLLLLTLKIKIKGLNCIWRFPPVHFRKSLYTQVSKHKIWAWTCRVLHFPSETGSIINLLLASFTYEVLWVRCYEFYHMTWPTIESWRSEDRRKQGMLCGFATFSRAWIWCHGCERLICPGFSSHTLKPGAPLTWVWPLN